ncbi:MAG TPA: monovalent cation/H(+) antiporter subunit G [Acidimicrobiales bacterium]|nr:monovalent cation/H(+) antiporter subunit G [Acidimicrobiales bacterium]
MLTLQSVVVDVLLALAVLVVFLSSLGVLLMRDVFQKLHFVTPAALVAPVLVALAVTVEQGWSSNTTQTWLALLFVATTGPVLAHATARAARVRQQGDWRGPDDPVDRSADPVSGD